VLWRTFGATGLVALCGSHASLVLRAARSDDSPVVRSLLQASIALGALDTALGLLPILDIAPDVGEAYARLAAVLIVVFLLATALPPVLRRIAPAQERAPRDPFGRGDSPVERLAAELLAVADRLEALDASPGIRAEAAGLRALAREATR
jgi:hypothetical protein